MAIRESQLRQAQIALNETLGATEIALRNLFRTLERLRNSLGAKALNVTLAERAFDLAQSGYTVGVRELLEVRDAQRELLSAQFVLLQERFNWISTMLEIQFLLGIDREGMEAYRNG